MSGKRSQEEQEITPLYRSNSDESNNMSVHSVPVRKKTSIIRKIRYVFSFIWNVIMEFCKSALPLTWRKKKSINGQVVLITGAGGCLGSLLAQHLTLLGARLVLWDLDETANNITAEKCRKLGCDEVFTYTVNIANRDEVYSNAKRVMNEVGDVSILINNAGILHARFFMETDDAKLDQIIDVNTKAHFWTVKAFLPSMLVSNSGHIVSLASLAGFVGAPGLVDYSTSKFAAVGFMEALANELVVLGKQNIKTTIVCPTFIRNKMIENLDCSRYDDFLSPEFVAEKTINAILSDMKMLILPKKMNYLYFLKGLIPVSCFQMIITKKKVIS